MKKVLLFIVFLMLFLVRIPPVFGQEQKDIFEMSLDDLAGLEVITASRYKQDISEAPANITVITREMIERRGYRNLLEILEDLPGFDFATYEDGGGENILFMD